MDVVVDLARLSVNAEAVAVAVSNGNEARVPPYVATAMLYRPILEKTLQYLGADFPRPGNRSGREELFVLEEHRAWQGPRLTVVNGKEIAQLRRQGRSDGCFQLCQCLWRCGRSKRVDRRSTLRECVKRSNPDLP